MNKLYKLTDENCYTMHNTLWGENVTHKAKPGKNHLCSEYYIHAYEDPLIAILLNPCHANFKNPIIWEAKGRIRLRDGQLKCGCKSLTTIKQIPLPKITLEQRVTFAIRCVRAVFTNCTEWNNWAPNWLNGINRSAYAASNAANAAAYAATNDAGKGTLDIIKIAHEVCDG